MRNTEMGQSRGEIAPGLRSLPIEQHVVHRAISGDEIIVVRVLNRRQPPRRQLPDQ